MAEPKVGMVLELPGKPPIDKGERTKQRFLDRAQDQAAKADTVLTERVRQALGADHLLRCGDVAHMRVAVKDGVATLTGHVGQSINKARAEVAAHEALGVTAVINHLMVDNELMIDVAQAAHFTTFDPHNFGPPPADWQPPYPYQPADVLFHRHRSQKESL